ncbi:MAG: sulfatase [Planctomycetota bacterium]
MRLPPALFSRSILAFTAALALSCGAEDSPEFSGARWVRGHWIPLGPPPSTLDETIARFDGRAFDASWRVVPGGGKVDEQVTRTADESPGVVIQGEGARLAALPVDLLASDLHRVSLSLDVSEGESEGIRLAFETKERIRAYSTVESVQGGAGPEQVTFELDRVRRLEGRIDRVVVGTLGLTSQCVLRTLEFSRQPRLHHLPTPHDGRGLLRVEQDGRHGVALDAEHPVGLSVDAPAGSTFELTYRVGTNEALGGAQLVLEGLGARPERLPLGAEEGFAWRTFRTTLSARAPDQVRISLEGGPEGAIGFVTNPGAIVGTPVESPRTVLLVTSDTHRGELIGAAAEGAVRTPALDALAGRGVVFLDATSTSNSTNPSHIALMTGLHPRDTQIVTNRDPLSVEAQTLAELFAARGWRTAAAFSAFHLGDETSGLAQGFDVYDGPIAPTGLDFDAFTGESTEVREGAITVERALAQLDAAEGVPLFLWVHLFDAHAPYVAPSSFRGRELAVSAPPVETRDAPETIRLQRHPAKTWNSYRNMVEYVDHVLDPLLARPRVQEGITAFTSDHGESFGEHGIWWNHAGVFPATTQVPLIVAWPGAPGRRVETPVRQRDIGRTILGLAGLDEPDFPGRDLRDALAEDVPSYPRFALGYHGRSASIDDGRWLLVLHLLEEENDAGTHVWRPGEVELFDRERDRSGVVDVVAENLERARTMRRRLIDWLASGDPEGLKGEYRINAAIDEALAELGYSGGSESSALWYDAERGDAFIERFGEE